MADQKSKYEQVIKALECCRDFGDCSLCPYERATYGDELDCTENMHTDALALIIRQNAEIADLQDALKCEKETNAHLCGEYMSAKSEVAVEIIDDILEALQGESDLEDSRGRECYEKGDMEGHHIHQYAEEKLETLVIALSLYKKKYTEDQT